MTCQQQMGCRSCKLPSPLARKQPTCVANVNRAAAWLMHQAFSSSDLQMFACRATWAECMWDFQLPGTPVHAQRHLKTSCRGAAGMQALAVSALPSPGNARGWCRVCLDLFHMICMPADNFLCVLLRACPWLWLHGSPALCCQQCSCAVCAVCCTPAVTACYCQCESGYLEVLAAALQYMLCCSCSS